MSKDKANLLAALVRLSELATHAASVLAHQNDAPTAEDLAGLQWEIHNAAEASGVAMTDVYKGILDGIAVEYE